MTYAPQEKPVEVIRRIDGATGFVAFSEVGGVDPQRTIEPLVVVPMYCEFRLEMLGMEGPSADDTWADTGAYGIWAAGQIIPEDLGRIPFNTQIGNMSVPIVTAQVHIDRAIFGYTTDHAGVGDYMVRIRGTILTRRDFIQERVGAPPLRPSIFSELYDLVRGRT